ncbi:protein-methionine-sulfoxide reductase catalytic subunit MsrP [Deferrisoma camini]|uniref:protein-methionine-sulfoxide reductase catalytic subunit MsrP n=1 Tax=Deferrisoma camini TaxID=1035120 RepID=UPI00046D0CDE|nr:protein-methionine-sulfoxide reductase catalytic subunit MsrP [Deferrisoma camini]
MPLRLPSLPITPEGVWADRRRFLARLGLRGLGVWGLLTRPGWGLDLPPPAGPITPEASATRFNNYYEFTPDKRRVWREVAALRTRPWAVEIGGLVAKPRTVDVGDLARRLGTVDRVYRHRCVEGWSAVIPWTGIPLRALVDWAQPLGSARYVAFTAFLDPKVAPGQARHPDWPWPYTEGLTLAEARNPLALLATGAYGKPLAKSLGAPIRLVVPWKYGFKSIKGIVRIRFTEARPATFWTTLAPGVYGFSSNVAGGDREWRIDTGERQPTPRLNGYGPWVAYLYGG